MIVPRLIHPVSIFLQQIEKDETPLMDENLYEPVGQVQRAQAPIELQAQHQSVDLRNPSADAGSIIEGSEGYFLFLTRDLNEKGITINRGDLIVQVGVGNFKQEVNFYILGFKLMGHYSAQNGPTLLRANYQDRHPSRE